MRMVFAIAIALAVQASAHACSWDRDTLAMQFNKFPDLVRVITGRFERNPPLYYSMRIDRVKKEIKASPNKLDLYDDIAVATDRLGKSGKAIAWMEKKRLQMKGASSEDQYRTEANEGTFLIHDWIRSGKKHPLSEIQKGHDMIAKALAINPDAHFGREKVQLQVVEWLISQQKESDTAGEGRRRQTCRR